MSGGGFGSPLRFLSARGYSRLQLHPAFEMVADRKHWKNPINALVEADDAKLAIIAAAVPFFTGSLAEITKGRKRGTFRVRAAGYYETVGA